MDAPPRSEPLASASLRTRSWLGLEPSKMKAMRLSCPGMDATGQALTNHGFSSRDPANANAYKNPLTPGIS